MPTTLKVWDFSRRSAEILQPTYDTQPSNLGLRKELKQVVFPKVLLSQIALETLPTRR